MEAKHMEDAFKFIGLELKDNPDADVSMLIEQAAQKFDLTPLQTEFLVNKFVLER
ncbi:MAG TPA: hypothetical protein PK200_00230 [Spirochaetota bacterium]|nr:hypothetical protein [Spirochaetota bacterium]HQO01919.1 hypothetical protein [Spirochaetota bacterium]HQP49204.1 hypothetical protein [Spirochaetota bacterium]